MGEGYQLREGMEEAAFVEAIRKNELHRIAGHAMWLGQHYRAASSIGKTNEDSIESPHDQVHVLLGYPMASLMHAAFHPIFWLHHSNIDRLYESYLRYHPDSQLEFESNQEAQHVVHPKQKARDRYDHWLEPFHLPKSISPSAEKFYPRHSFETRRLGYVYDHLLTRPNQALTAPPVRAVFSSIDITALPSSYQLLVYGYKKGSAKEIFEDPPLGPTLADALAHPNYLGLGALFAGRADVCANCQEGEPFDVRVDITSGLRRLGLSPSEVELKVIVFACSEHPGEWLTLDQTPIPQPEVHGGRGGPPPRPRLDLMDDAPVAAASSSSSTEQGDTPTFQPNSIVSFCVGAAPGSSHAAPSAGSPKCFTSGPAR